MGKIIKKIKTIKRRYTEQLEPSSSKETRRKLHRLCNLEAYGEEAIAC
jgi:hypothetical protein